MSIETDIRSYLTGDSTVAGLVATSDSPPAYRIYPMRLPQGYDLPAISYQRISSERVHIQSDGPIGYCWARFQFDAWAETYAKVRELAEAMREALDGWSNLYIEGERDLFDEGVEIYRVTQDYLVPYSETP